MKINLSRFFRYGLVVALNILCIFTLQYFINSQNNVSKLLSDLKVSVFINQSTSDEINDENVIDKRTIIARNGFMRQKYTNNP